MFKIEFHIEHQGCLANELSRAFPELRFICPGGFIAEGSVSELVAIDEPSDEDVEAVMDFFASRPEITEARMLERTADKAFIYYTSSRLPETFCSQVVQRNCCFPIGMEIQEAGLEKWTVACLERGQAEALLKGLAALGPIRHAEITEPSWQDLLAPAVKK